MVHSLNEAPINYIPHQEVVSMSNKNTGEKLTIRKKKSFWPGSGEYDSIEIKRGGKKTDSKTGTGATRNVSGSARFDMARHHFFARSDPAHPSLCFSAMGLTRPANAFGLPQFYITPQFVYSYNLSR